jgi:hypothetical protein
MWSFEHSIDCPVAREFAWEFWTNVANWPVVDPAVEAVTLDGEFVSGTLGTTKPRDMEPVNWRLADVEYGTSTIVEINVPGASAKFSWVFEDAENGTRITQRASIEGERADEYAAFGEELEKQMPPGMQRLADAIAVAASRKE